jgi:tRNA dimethylallyltransferase
MPTFLPRILAIVGPTGSGKSALALSVADRCESELVSADSRQIYQGLDIGTAKPSLAEREKVRHHFVDTLPPSIEFSAGQFGSAARDEIADILRRNRLPILVGGSGLYIRAVLDGLSNTPPKDPEIRASLEKLLKNDGLENLMNALKAVDPLTVEKMKEITPRRVIRALEVHRITGTPISQMQAEENEEASFDSYQAGLLWERSELYQRIEKRVDAMISSGLVDEVRSLKSKGLGRDLNALNTVGYKEVFDFLDGNIDKEEMIRLIKRNSRRFAKRQMTWFKRDSRIHWIHVSGEDWLEKATQKIVDVINARFNQEM